MLYIDNLSPVDFVSWCVLNHVAWRSVACPMFELGLTTKFEYLEELQVYIVWRKMPI